MVEKKDEKTFGRRFVPLALKAALLGIIAYLPMYFLGAFISPIQHFIPWQESLTNIFTGLFIFFLVTGVFLSGTIFQYVLGVARTIILMVYFFLILNGGIVTLQMPIEGTTGKLIVDLTIILSMLMSVCLLEIGKNVVQAIEFKTQGLLKISQ